MPSSWALAGGLSPRVLQLVSQSGKTIRETRDRAESPQESGQFIGMGAKRLRERVWPVISFARC